MSDSTSNSITAAPAVSQRILHDGKEYTTIKEGLAYILIPALASTIPQTTPKGDNESQSVFYNPIQQFNRDLSVLAIKAYGEEAMEKKKADMEKSYKMWSNVKRGKKRKRGEDTTDGDQSGPAIELEATDKAGELNGMAVTNPSIDTETHSVRTSMELGGNLEGINEAIAQETTRSETEILTSKTQLESDPVSVSNKITISLSEQLDEPSPHKPRVPSFTILDALSATGLRALRYAHEIRFVTSVTANDLLPAATASINLNVQHNNLTEKITSITGNALSHMYSLVGDDIGHKGRLKASKKYDVIDLDPYGTAVPFLDAAVQSVRDDGGLLCVTCTDGGVWASNGYPEKAYSLYGGIPIKGQHSHEGGIRLILHAIATSAARYGLAMEPLLSLSIDFYARVFVRIRKSPADVKFLAGKTMLVYNCDSGCGAWTTQLLARNKLSQNKSGTGTFYKHVFAQGPSTGALCEHCGTKTHMAGPMYAGPLHSPTFIQRILNELPNASDDVYGTKARIEGMLTLALEEHLPPLETEPSPNASTTPPTKEGQSDRAMIDHYPFFIVPSVLAKVIHCVTPHENALRGALRYLGYRVTRSHTKAGSIKTDAPWNVIWEVMREWVRQKAPVKEGVIRKGTAGWKILGFDKVGESDDSHASSDHVSQEGGPMKENDNLTSAANDTSNGPKLKIVFDEELGKYQEIRKLVRYQLNPRENWGPMSRAKGH